MGLQTGVEDVVHNTHKLLVSAAMYPAVAAALCQLYIAQNADSGVVDTFRDRAAEVGVEYDTMEEDGIRLFRASNPACITDHASVVLNLTGFLADAGTEHSQQQNSHRLADVRARPRGR